MKEPPIILVWKEQKTLLVLSLITFSVTTLFEVCCDFPSKNSGPIHWMYILRDSLLEQSITELRGKINLLDEAVKVSSEVTRPCVIELRIDYQRLACESLV